MQRLSLLIRLLHFYITKKKKGERGMTLVISVTAPWEKGKKGKKIRRKKAQRMQYACYTRGHRHIHLKEGKGKDEEGRKKSGGTKYLDLGIYYLLKLLKLMKKEKREKRGKKGRKYRTLKQVRIWNNFLFHHIFHKRKRGGRGGKRDGKKRRTKENCSGNPRV